MKFFTGKYLIFILVLVSALLTRLDLPVHWHSNGVCLVLRPALSQPVLLSGVAMVALC